MRLWVQFANVELFDAEVLFCIWICSAGRLLDSEISMSWIQQGWMVMQLLFYDPHTHTHSLTRCVSNTWVFSLGGVLRAVLFVTPPRPGSPVFDRVPVRVMVLSLSPRLISNISDSTWKQPVASLRHSCWLSYSICGEVFRFSLKSLVYLKLVNVVAEGFCLQVSWEVMFSVVVGARHAPSQYLCVCLVLYSESVLRSPVCISVKSCHIFFLTLLPLPCFLNLGGNWAPSRPPAEC